MREFKDRSNPALGIQQTSEQSGVAVDVIIEIRKTGTSEHWGQQLEEIVILSREALLNDLPVTTEEKNLNMLFRNEFGDIGYHDVLRAYELHPTRRAAYFVNGKSILDHWEKTPPMCKLK